MLYEQAVGPADMHSHNGLNRNYGIGSKQAEHKDFSELLTCPVRYSAMPEEEHLEVMDEMMKAWHNTT